MTAASPGSPPGEADLGGRRQMTGCPETHPHPASGDRLPAGKDTPDPYPASGRCLITATPPAGTDRGSPSW